jgi:D-xylose transport system permease protein
MTPDDSEQLTSGVAGSSGVGVADEVAAEVEASEPDPTEAEAAVAIVPLEGSLAEYVSAWARRVRSGESGVLPVLAGLIVITIIFQWRSPVFLSAANLANLLEQGAPFVLLGMAEVFVLLLGEIDLSVGFVAGIAAVITATLAAPPHNFSWPVSVAAGLAAAAAIGFLQGMLITRLRLPSFVVTLAGLLGWEGVLIALINLQNADNGGTIRISNKVILDFVSGSLSATVGWVVMAAGVILFGVLAILRDRRRRASGLAAPPLALTALKIIATAVAGVVLVLVCNRNRGLFGTTLNGVPWVVPIVLGFLIAWTLLLERTRFGRYVYAIGGNAEAARRAGINVNRIRVIAFTFCSLTAGAGGIIYASRLGSISSDVDGGTLVLYAVAAAVIGGTSLFGGRGKMIHAVLGGMVFAAIYNGMGLIGLAADTQYMVTALVLLAAVTIDAVARRGRVV